MPSNAMIALAAIAVGIAATGTLLTVKELKQSSRSHRYIIVVFLLFVYLVTLPLVIAFAPGIYTLYLPVALPVLLTLPPALYMYVDARTNEGAAFHALSSSVISWRHGVLPAAGVIVTLGFWVLPDSQRIIMFIGGELPPISEQANLAKTLALLSFALITIWSFASLAYLIAVLKRLQGYRAALKEHFSNTDNRELRWIDCFMVFLLILWLVSAVSLISDNYGRGQLFPAEVVMGLTATLVLFLVVFALGGSAIQSRAKSDSPSVAVVPPSRKYERSGLTPELARQLAKRIEAAMQQDKLFLDPDLTLGKLANHVNGAPNAVSQTLNEHLNSTFFDFVAHWRINAAKPRVLDASSSILDIAMDVGFNSRSTFYKAFKKETGLSPKDYRSASRLEKEKRGR